MKIRILGILLALGLVLGACGEDAPVNEQVEEVVNGAITRSVVTEELEELLNSQVGLRDIGVVELESGFAVTARFGKPQVHITAFGSTCVLVNLVVSRYFTEHELHLSSLTIVLNDTDDELVQSWRTTDFYSGMLTDFITGESFIVTTEGLPSIN